MDGQNKEKNQSLKILQHLNTLRIDHSSRSCLSELINQIKNNTTAYPVSKEDWHLLWQKMGLSLSQSQYKKIVSRFPPHEQKIAEDARKRTLKLRK